MSEIVFNESDKLLRMAGQIESFYAPYPDDVATKEIAMHINKFWNRAMRAGFLAAFPEGDARLSARLAAARALVRPA